MKCHRHIIAILACFILTASAAPQGSADPYASLTPEQRAILKPGVERYFEDQLHEKWSDLWEIQDQTSRLKNELLLGNRSAPDMSREQFVRAMKETMGIGYPQLRSFKLSVVNPDNENFIVFGCAKATRESWRQTSLVMVHVKIIDGKPKFDLFEMTPDSCSNK